MRSLNLLTSSRWRQDRVSGRTVIPYQFPDSSFSRDNKNNIRRYLDELEDRTGCLKFTERAREQNYINVRGERAGGCFSALGQESAGGQTLNIPSDCRTKAIIQHEFMHAIGMHHEHVRPDRDQFVNIIWSNIDLDSQRANTNFGKTNLPTLGSPYDFGSVMHYSATAFSKDRRTLPTITPKISGVTITRASEASDIDIKKIKLMYQCEGAALRQWGDLNSSPCTTNCKCQSGQTGCGSNNNACHGSLVCSSNRCVSSSNPTPTPPSPTPSPSPSGRPYLVWQQNPQDGRNYCIDLRGANTANLNAVWYYRCNLTPGKFNFEHSS